VNDVTYSQYYVKLSGVNRLSFVPEKFIHNLKFKKMNTTELKGNWNEQKAKLKQKFAVLTDNDLMFEEGKKEEMFGKLQIKLGKTKEELHKIIEAL
jgi:CsbD-like.